MIHVETIVRKLLPELCKNHTLSLICLSTSNPVYLIFIESSHSPDIVARFSQSDDVCKIHQVTERLHKLLGDLIPEPLALVKDDGQNISMQKGLAGSPWFQLAEKQPCLAQREKTHARAVDTLNQMHLAISSVSDWVKVIRPGDELRRSYKKCIDSGTTLPTGTEVVVKQLCKTLDNFGELSSFSQHGDFCLNNLIIDDTQVHIIDFEDFGVTFMPFHDQLTLALSFYKLAPKSAHISLNNAISICINNKALPQQALDTSLLPGFFMHHLLLRLGSWSQSQKRLEYRQWLLSILETFNRSPGSLFQ